MPSANSGRIKIIPRLFGGLGNQLFIYAAARRLAYVNRVDLVIDDVSGFRYDQQYNRHYQLDYFGIPCRKASPTERLEPFSRARRCIKRRWNQRLPFEKRTYICQEGVDFDPRLLQVKPNGTVYLEGYWQSEIYFKDIESVIRKDLRIIPPRDTINQTMAERIRSCQAIAVHVRFFDAPLEKAVNNVPADYYTRAIAKMEDLNPNANYFIFSDLPEAARSLIHISDDRVTVVSHNKGDDGAYADLRLMTQCQHFIIANSTFSWWGAWLGGDNNKIVIVPGFEIREGKMAWGFKGLIPEGWMAF